MAADAVVAQTETPSDQLSFIDSWHAQIAALASESTAIGKESGTSQPVSSSYLQWGAGAIAGEASDKDELKPVRVQNAVAHAAPGAETNNNSWDARVTKNATVFKRAFGPDEKESRHRSADGAPLSQKAVLTENTPAMQVIPVEVPLHAPKLESPKAEAGSENANGPSSISESTLIAPAALHGPSSSLSALPLAGLVAELPRRGGGGRTSTEQSRGAGESLHADFSAAIQESANTQAASAPGDSAGEVEIHRNPQGGAVIADVGMTQDAGIGQISHAGGQGNDSVLLHATNDLSRRQLTVSRPDDSTQGVEQQHSRDTVHAITQQGRDELATMPQPHAVENANDPGVADRKARRSGSVSGVAMQREESSRHTSVLLTGASAVDSTRPPNPEAAGATAFASAGNRTVAMEKPGIQETMNALDGGGNIDSRVLNWTHAGRAHAEAGYQDPALGWVGVRAEVSGGAVHATVVPQSAEAAQALQERLVGLHTYLNEHHTPVESLSLAGFGGSAHQSPHHGAGHGAQHGAEGQPGQSNVPEQTLNIGTAVRSIANLANHELPLAAAPGSRYISVVA